VPLGLEILAKAQIVRPVVSGHHHATEGIGGARTAVVVLFEVDLDHQVVVASLELDQQNRRLRTPGPWVNRVQVVDELARAAGPGDGTRMIADQRFQPSIAPSQ